MTTIIHIGSSKALSTTVQSHMQTLDNDFFYFGINFDKQKFEKKGVGHSFLDEDCEKLTKILVNLDRYKGLDPQLKQNIQQKVKLAEEQNKIFFYSSESLCETPNLYLTMQILKEIFIDFKILYITRNQFDTIKSLYFYEGHKSSYFTKKKKFRYTSFRTFFETGVQTDILRGGHKSNYWVHDFIRIYNFNQVTEVLSKFIPKENILVFPFEEIVRKGDINTILKFIENKTNKKISSKILNEDKSLNLINVSNKKDIFFKLYAILSVLGINPHNLNKKVKRFIDIKKLLKNFNDLNIDRKYFLEIKKIFLNDNLELIEKFDSLKEHKSKYLFEE